VDGHYVYGLLLFDAVGLVFLIAVDDLKDLTGFGHVLRLLTITIRQVNVDSLHQEKLADLEVVSLGSQVQTTASLRVRVVQVRPLVFQQHVHDPRVAVPTGDFERHPFLLSLQVWVCVLLENEVVHDGFVAHGAGYVQRSEMV